MSATGAAKLYTPDILALAVQLANFPLSDDFRIRTQVRSRTCGSSLELGAQVDQDGAVGRLGMQVSACAIGQAAAALFAGDSKGRTLADMLNSLQALENWLADDVVAPQWKDIGILEAARAHPARHGAILLPWRAAIEVLSKD